MRCGTTTLFRCTHTKQRRSFFSLLFPFFSSLFLLYGGAISTHSRRILAAGYTSTGSLRGRPTGSRTPDWRTPCWSIRRCCTGSTNGQKKQKSEPEATARRNHPQPRLRSTSTTAQPVVRRHVHAEYWRREMCSYATFRCMARMMVQISAQLFRTRARRILPLPPLFLLGFGFAVATC